MGRFFSFLIFIIFINGTNGSSQARNSYKILYVGNSLTYVNDLPALINELASMDSVNISYKTFLYPDYSLEDHWKEGKVEEEIENGKYDFVVMQQGPSAAAESQVLLLDYVRRFAEVGKKVNTWSALYMVWPSKARSFDLENVIKSYSNAAKATSSILCPAGLAWKIAWESNDALNLYGPDNFHPSVKGSVLAALTLYASLFKKDSLEFVNYKNITWNKDVTADEFTLLKKAALKSLQ